ncbi:MAG: hypothetical protein ACP5R5_05585 [Armatimonadota bacterium]
MRSSEIALIGLCAAMTMVAASVGLADVVVVNGDNYASLNWVVYQKDAANGGTAYAFADMAPGQSTIGRGAFYASTGTGGGTTALGAGQIWLGTDQFTGVRLRDITKLEYTTFTYVCGNGPAPSQNDYCRQPIQLQLAVQLTPGGQWAYLMHRPWGMIGQNDGNDVLHMGFWETWNALGSDLWYVAYDESSVGQQWTWAEIIMNHPDAVLATPPVGTKWDVPFTGTGCSLNFEVGARKRANAVVFGLTNYSTWWKESEGFRGYVDKFTIEAIDNSDPQNPVTIIPETTFDFEGSNPVTRTVFMTNRAAWDTCISLNRDENYMFSDQQFLPSPQEHQGSFVKLFGKVVEYTDFGQPFRIDDGSGRSVKIVAPGHTIPPPSEFDPDIYVEATGTLHQILWPDEQPPINDRTLTCRPENVERVFP